MSFSAIGATHTSLGWSEAQPQVKATNRPSAGGATYRSPPNLRQERLSVPKRHDLLYSVMATALPNRLRQVLLVALVVGELISVCACQSPSSPYFHELKIDSGLHLSVSKGIDLPPGQSPHFGSYYAPFYGAFVTSMDHMEKKARSVSPERALYLETNREQVLDRTVKEDEVLSGPFGSLNAKRECFYTRPIETTFGSVSVEFNGNGTQHEVPLVISGPPKDLPALTSLSLVRIFHTGAVYITVTANYEPDGRLGSLDYGSASNGRPSPGPSGTAIYRTADPVVDELQRRQLAPDLERYGIPISIAVNEYLQSRTLTLPASSLRQYRNVLHAFYGFGKFIHQDELRDGIVVTSRWLQPSQTREEKDTLNTLCDERFRKQQALGLPTVE